MTIAVILAGGMGSRMDWPVPKQYIKVNGRYMLSYSLETVLTHPAIEQVVVVAEKEWRSLVYECLDAIHEKKPVCFAHPGPSRQSSVRNAFRIITQKIGAGDDDIVLVHEAARPLVSAELVSRCIKSMTMADAVLPAVPVKDTIYASNDGEGVIDVVPRSMLRCGQAPEVFRFGPYYRLMEEMSEEELSKVTGSVELAFRKGLRCRLVPGEDDNFKITTREDLYKFKARLSGMEDLT